VDRARGPARGRVLADRPSPRLPTRRGRSMRFARLPELAVVALALLAAPLAGGAQPAGRVARIGDLWLGSPLSQAEIQRLTLPRGLRELGWIPGQNVVIERLYAEGKAERFPDLAAELVRLKVDVIVSNEETALIAAKRVTRSIPIVMVGATDPVRLG